MEQWFCQRRVGWMKTVDMNSDPPSYENTCNCWAELPTARSLQHFSPKEVPWAGMSFTATQHLYSWSLWSNASCSTKLAEACWSLHGFLHGVEWELANELRELAHDTLVCVSALYWRKTRQPPQGQEGQLDHVPVQLETFSFVTVPRLSTGDVCKFENELARHAFMEVSYDCVCLCLFVIVTWGTCF